MKSSNAFVTGSYTNGIYDLEEIIQDVEGQYEFRAVTPLICKQIYCQPCQIKFSIQDLLIVSIAPSDPNPVVHQDDQS